MTLCTPTPTPGITVSGSATPAKTPTRTSTKTPTKTPNSSPTKTPLPTLTATKTHSNSQSTTRTRTKSSSPEISKTPEPTITNSITKTRTDTGTPVKTPNKSSTPSNYSTPTPSVSLTRSNTKTPTQSITFTPTKTITSTPTLTRTNTQTETPTKTASPTYTATRTNSATPTATKTGSCTMTTTKTSSGTRTAGPTSTATKTSSSTITNTKTNSKSLTVTNTNTASTTPTKTLTSTQTPTLSMSLSQTQTQTITSTRTGTVTSSVTLSNYSTPTCTSTQTPSISLTTTVTPSISQSSTPPRTPTFTRTQSKTLSSTITSTVSVSLSNTATYTPTNSRSATQTNTSTPTISSTTTITPTYTVTPSMTYTQTHTTTTTKTNSPTTTESATPTYTPTNSRTASISFTPTDTPTRTPTFTRTSSETGTPTPTMTRTSSMTPTPTHTNTVTPSATIVCEIETITDPVEATITIDRNTRIVADNGPINIDLINYTSSICPLNAYPAPGRTLILDGSSTEYNTVYQVFPGFSPVKLRIQKEGTGTWVFTDNVSNWKSRDPSGSKHLLFNEGTIILAGDATGGSATGSIIGKANDPQLPVFGSTDFSEPVALLLARRARDNNGNLIAEVYREPSTFSRTLLIPSGATNSDIILGGSSYGNQTGLFGTFDANSAFRIGSDKLTFACDPNGYVRFLTPPDNFDKQDGSPDPEFTLNIGTSTMTGDVWLQTRLPASVVNSLHVRTGKLITFFDYAFGATLGNPITLTSPPPLTIGSEYSSATMDLNIPEDSFQYANPNISTVQGFNSTTLIGNDNLITGGTFRLFNNGTDPTVTVQAGTHTISSDLIFDTTPTFDVSDGCQITVGGTIQPTSAGLIKNGLGTLILQEAVGYSGTTNIIDGSLTVNSIISGPSIIDSVVFTSGNLTINFNSEPSVDDTFQILLGSTTQTYATENIVLVGVTGTYIPSYDESISTLTINE